MPRVTTIRSTPTRTTRNPFTAPAATVARIAAALAATAFQWCSTTSTGTSVAASPCMEANDRSNSLTTRVASRPRLMKTSASWEPKIVCTVPA
jgi:hypothetical protein